MIKDVELASIQGHHPHPYGIYYAVTEQYKTTIILDKFDWFFMLEIKGQ